MSELGDRLRSRRKELRLTIRQLAKRCGLSASFLCDVERGKRGIGADSLVAIGQVVGMPIDQLMGAGEVRTTGVNVQLPQSLMAFAQSTEIAFRSVMCLYWMSRTIMDHRKNESRISLEDVDWSLFYESVRAFI